MMALSITIILIIITQIYIVLFKEPKVTLQTHTHTKRQTKKKKTPQSKAKGFSEYMTVYLFLKNAQRQGRVDLRGKHVVQSGGNSAEGSVLERLWSDVGDGD